MSSGSSPDKLDPSSAKTHPDNSHNDAGSDVVKVPRAVLAAYGSLAFPLAAAFIALQVIVPTFYAKNNA